MSEDLQCDDHKSDTDDESRIIEELTTQVLASCENAFQNGIDSCDIYDLLMDLIKNDIDEDEEEPSQKKSIPSQIINNLFAVFCFIRKAIWISIFLSISVIGTYWFFINYLEIALWPLSLLQDERCLLPSHPIIMEITRPISNCSICQPHYPNVTPLIEFNKIPTSEEFETVAYSSKPIIVRGGTKSSNMSLDFNLEALKQIFESEPGGIESVMTECQFLPFRSSFKNLHEVISEAENVETPWYVGWSNCHPGIVEKLRKLFPRPNFLPKDSESSAIDWIFIGSPGYGAAMHLDYVRRPSWQAQLSGRKRWKVRPVPECELSCPIELVFIINKGDMLFLDTNSWYHETVIEGKEISISIGSEYD